MTAATMNELDRLRQDRDALRARAQEAEETNHLLLQLIAKIRAAAGDPTGKMMQPELIAHIQEMRDVLIQERADMRRTGGGISADTIGRMQAVIVAAGGGRWEVSEFKREERYIVLKRRDMTKDEEAGLREYILQQGLITRECVVVEPDWAIYDIVWHLVERVATGQRLPFMTDEDPDKIRAERDKAEQRAERDLDAFHILCQSLKRLEEIVGIDTGGWNGPAPALDAVEQIQRERDALAAHVELLSRAAYEVCNDSFSYGGTSMAVNAAGDLATGDRGKYPCSMTALAEAAVSSPTTSLARMRDERAQAIQRAVKQARRDWAREDKAAIERRDLLKQAEALENLATRSRYDEVYGEQVVPAAELKKEAGILRRQAEEPTP